MTAITDRGSSPLRCPDKHKGGLRFRLGMEKFMRRLFSSNSDLQILDLEPQDRLAHLSDCQNHGQRKTCN